MTIVYLNCLDCGNDFEIEDVPTTSIVATDYENEDDNCPKCKSYNTEIDFVEMG